MVQRTGRDGGEEQGDGEDTRSGGRPQSQVRARRRRVRVLNKVKEVGKISNCRIPKIPSKMKIPAIIRRLKSDFL